MTPHDPTEQHEPGPMEKWLLTHCRWCFAECSGTVCLCGKAWCCDDQALPPDHRSLFAAAREADAERAALIRQRDELLALVEDAAKVARLVSDNGGGAAGYSAVCALDERLTIGLAAAKGGGA